MSTKFSYRLLALGFALGTSACAYTERVEGVSAHAGNALAINEAKQMVDPWNPDAYDTAINGNSERIGNGIDRLNRRSREEDQQVNSPDTRSN